MSEKTKIQFSAEELELMKNQHWILTKNRIIEKISFGLEQLAEQLRSEVIAFYPDIAEHLLAAGYKVSRGEKYQGLPYLILDFPRIFGKVDVLAIRVMFWWGKFYAVTLHTKGWYAANLKMALHTTNVDDPDLLIAYEGDEWNHDLADSSYQSLQNTLLVTKRLSGDQFIKISKQVELKSWEDAEKELHSAFHRLLQLVNISFQSGERGL